MAGLARIWHSYGCGVGQQLQLRLYPEAWEPPHAVGTALKKTKKKKLLWLFWLLGVFRVSIQKHERRVPNT